MNIQLLYLIFHSAAYCAMPHTVCEAFLRLLFKRVLNQLLVSLNSLL